MTKKCLASNLLSLWEDFGGSIGRANTIAIFGVFDFEDLGEAILPLKYFDNLNLGLNFLSD